MRVNRSTRSSQRQSQRTRQQIVTRAVDFYECPQCRGLFTLYHGSYKRHTKSCEAKYAARAREDARLCAERIDTPTPDPYSPVPTDIEVGVDGTAGAGMYFFIAITIGVHGRFSVTQRDCPTR